MKIFELGEGFFKVDKKNLVITIVETSCDYEGVIVTRHAARTSFPTDNLEFWGMLLEICRELQWECSTYPKRERLISHLKSVEKEIESLLNFARGGK